MARPLKDGVGYFPKDTDFYADDKVRRVKSEFGAKGMYILDFLLCETYGKEGYFIKWDEDKCYLLADSLGCGCSQELISEVVKRLVKCNFFDEDIFNRFNVTTSAGIQRRYIRMFAHREKINFIEEYFLLNVDNPKDIPTAILNKVTLENINNKKTLLESKKTPQSKVNESKVNEMKCKSDETSSIQSVDYAFPLHDGEAIITAATIDIWKDNYPYIDIEGTLARIQEYVKANPQKRSGEISLMSFIKKWLAQDQENAEKELKKMEGR